MTKAEILTKVCDLLTDIGLTNDDETFTYCEEIRNCLPSSYSIENKVLLIAPVDVSDSVESDGGGISDEQEECYAEIDEE